MGEEGLEESWRVGQFFFCIFFGNEFCCAGDDHGGSRARCAKLAERRSRQVQEPPGTINTAVLRVSSLFKLFVCTFEGGFSPRCLHSATQARQREEGRGGDVRGGGRSGGSGCFKCGEEVSN